MRRPTSDLAVFDTSSLSCVRRGVARFDAGGDVASAAHACDVADAASELAAADVAALYGVTRPANVVARYVVEFAS